MKYLFVFGFLLFSSLLIAQENWSTLKTGAGGWMTGMDINPSGAPIFARSDVGSAYRWDAESETWDNVVNAITLPVEDVYWNRFGGVLSLVSAPSNSDRAYLAYFDGIYKSDDQGNTWERTSFPTMEMPGNDDFSKTSGERLAVDPNNENHVYFASINNGLWRSEDGGDNWNVVQTVPLGENDRGVRQVLFDVSSGATDGKTNKLYVLIDGQGIFETTDSGLFWAPNSFSISDSYFLDAEISESGKLYVCGEQSDGSPLGVQRYDGVEWTEISPDPSTTFGELAIDPFNEDRLFIFSYGFTETYKTSTASTENPSWTYIAFSQSAENIPWMEWTVTDWFVIGEVVFNPAVEDELWKADGLGTWRTTDLADNDMTWNEEANGQEHLVSTDLIPLVDGGVVTTHWDRPVFYHGDVDEYPAIHQPSNRFNSAWDLEQSPSDPDFILAVIEDHRYCCFDDETRNSGFSTDGGQTWTPFLTQPDPIDSQIYGYLAVSANDNDNIVWIPSFDLAPYYTTDRGNTWTETILPGNSGSCCAGANFFDRNALTADRVLDNTFYIYDFGNGNVYQTTNGGAEWNTFPNVLNAFAFNGKLMAVPGQANHLLFARGPEQSIDFIDGLQRSTDGGETWTSFDNTDEVLNVAVGKAAPDSSYPTIFIQGRVDGDFGYFMSTDEGVSWNALGAYPLGIYDRAKILEGDMNIYGRLYVGFAGNGFVYHDIDVVLNNDELEEVSISEIDVWPNPSNDLVYIKGALKNYYLELRDINGKVISRKKCNSSNNESFDLSNVVPGVYLIAIKNSYNQIIEVKRVVKD